MMGAEMVLSKTALAAPTLHKLLDYQDEDTKEGDFEVGGGFEGNTRSRVWEGGGTCSTNWSSCVGNNVQHGGLCRLTIYAVLCNCHVPPPLPLQVSLFAELFLEMLQTRFGRDLLRALPLVKGATSSSGEHQHRAEWGDARGVPPSPGL